MQLPGGLLQVAPILPFGTCESLRPGQAVGAGSSGGSSAAIPGGENTYEKIRFTAYWSACGGRNHGAERGPTYRHGAATRRNQQFLIQETVEEELDAADSGQKVRNLAASHLDPVRVLERESRGRPPAKG